MTELDIEELERNVTGTDSVIAEEAKSFGALPDHEREDVRNVLAKMEAEQQDDSLDEEEVAIVMELAEVIEGVGKISYQLLKMCQRRNY